MALTTQIKYEINRVLRLTNLKLDTLTIENKEIRRLHELENCGYFENPAFPVPQGFLSLDPHTILDDLKLYRERFESFTDISKNDVGYSFANPWFSSPDSEVLYTFIRKFQPDRIIEVGSGYSTKIIRQAILDGKLDTHLLCIDPDPRIEIKDFADEVLLVPVENVSINVFKSLKADDILFIDSSHVLKPGGDVVFLYLKVIPELDSGILIHIHDVFLPWDYPIEPVIEKRWGWNEQYLVQAMLMFNDVFEILWAGYYLQRTFPEFNKYFTHINGRIAKSLWLRKLK